MNIHFPARININSSLSSDVEEMVRRMNGVFVDRGEFDIDFSDQSPHLPHLTLLMGTVRSKADLEQLIIRCKSFAESISSVEFSLSLPFWKKPSQRFMFVDALPAAKLRELRVALLSKLDDLIECEFHGGPENPSHITIGYGSERSVPLSVVKSRFTALSSRLVDLRITEAGERGTASDVIDSFPFGGNAA